MAYFRIYNRNKLQKVRNLKPVFKLINVATSQSTVSKEATCKAMLADE